MQSKAATVAQYLKELPPERRAIVAAVREVVLANLDPDFEEGMGYGMISWHVPHRVYPPGYHCDPKAPLPFACLASQKNYLSLYLMSIYGDPREEAWLRAEFAKAGKKLDMGKSCIRFRTLEDLPLAAIGAAVARVRAREYAERCDRALAARAKAGGRKAATSKAAPKAAARERAALKQATRKERPAPERKPSARKA